MFTWNRPGLSLNGQWKFCPDPMQRCRRQQWWRHLPATDGPFPCWDMEGLWAITVPGTWKTQFEALQWYDGHAVYMRDFEADLPPDHEAFLVFDGIVYSSQVYLNGQLAGEHEWGYSAFQLRVTELLRRKNRLFVLVENLLKGDRVPGEIFDWNNDGGIINGVKLVYVPRTYIQNFRVETRLSPSEARVAVEVRLQSRDVAARENVDAVFPELGLRIAGMARVGESLRLEVGVPRADLTLWSPADPKLYRLEIRTRHETLHDEVGLREVRTEGAQILLNNKPLRLYGLCVHSEFKDTGRTATPAGVDLMIEHARELGVNFLRCAHYPYAEIFGRAMDRAGLLWWQEAPAYWLANMAEEGQKRRACGMLEDTVRRDWNRASLIIWSVSNECCWRNHEKPSENNYAYWFKAVRLVRTLDPSRLISCAEAGNMISVRPVWTPAKGDAFDRTVDDAESWRPGHTDEWYALFDILAANLYVNTAEEAEIAYPRFVEMLKRYCKPLMLSEFGSMSQPGCIEPADRWGSEPRHAGLLRHTYALFERLPELVGTCVWCLMDVRAPIHWRWYNNGKAVFRYGILDEQHQKKSIVHEALKRSITTLRKRFGDAPPRLP